MRTADLRDGAAVARAVGGGFDGVCHLAAVTRVRDSAADPLGCFAVNVTGTLNLLHALDAAGSRPALVFCSSAAVHGGSEGRLDERAPVRPAGPYATSKLAAEQAIAAQAASGRLSAVTLRCFNVAGAAAGRGDTDPTRIIPRTLAVAAGRAEQVELNGDGGAVRDYAHVLDVAEAFRLALEAAGPPGCHRLYTVGTGRGVSLGELVRTARAVTGRPIPVVHRPPRPEARELVADSTRLRAELGWAPRHSGLEQILRDSWAALP